MNTLFTPSSRSTNLSRRTLQVAQITPKLPNIVKTGMAPIYSISSRSLDALDACTGACNLGLIIGCAAPVFIAISTFSIILLRRSIIARRSTVQQDEAISNGGSSFGMLYSRLSSIHVSRKSELAAIGSNPPGAEMISVETLSPRVLAEDEETTLEKTISDESQNQEERPSTPLLVLPSLSSMLGDFLSYGDAIAEQAEPDPTNKKRPGTPLLFTAPCSEIDFAEGSLSVESRPETSPVNEDGDSHLIAYMADRTTSMKMSADLTLNNNSEDFNGEADPFATMAVEDLALFLRSDVQMPITIRSKTNLAVTTTLWSILVDSNSTLETLLPVRLDDFPSIPGSQLIQGCAALPQAAPGRTTSASQSSLVSVLSKSMSAPASINLLDCVLEDIPRRIYLPPRCFAYFSQQCDPGQLWDEEDERRFSKAVTKGRPLRNTWAAGVSYSRSSSSEPGELWDDEDERRMSCQSSAHITDEHLEALSTFATLSFASAEITIGLGNFDGSFLSVSNIPLVGSIDGDTTTGTVGSLESARSTNELLPHKNTGADFSLFASYSGGLCICQEVFPGSPCVCDSDPSGGATIVELGEDIEPLKQDTSFGYQAFGDVHDHSNFSLHFDSDDVKSQVTSPGTNTTCPSTRSSLASFAGLLEFDIDAKGKCVVEDQDPVVDMDIEPNSYYLSAIRFIRLPWPWVSVDDL